MCPRYYVSCLLTKTDAPYRWLGDPSKQEELKVYLRTKSTLIAFAEFQTHLVNAKNVIVRKLGSGANQYRTFIKTNTGYKVTGDEGFVAVDTDGKTVKLVDRLEFSYQNFTAIKNWDS